MSNLEFLSRANKRISKSKEISETDIESTFVKFAKKSHALKLIFLNKSGFPDRTVLCPGARVFFVEFKRKGKKQSPVQKIVMELLRSVGFEYHVCDEIGQAENILKKFLLSTPV